ncbi:MAG TPA: hypothetical protein PK110_11560 [Niabella sp.]|jgi:hypothetical protein|nr:hypothetical protein [Chitinophagaceae bacterium]HRN48468.1 hypothetical protein [Niabella sp.]HRO85452.1 hypothetical protein [Niabella sp.]HUN02362.1 hypothetical protein [Niabella sp.]
MSIEEYLKKLQGDSEVNYTSVKQFIERNPIPVEDKNMISEIEKKTGLVFVTGDDVAERVCFANSSELRDDFKSSFTCGDMKCFFKGLLSQLIRKETLIEDNIFNADFDFWKFVEAGKNVQ